MRRTGIMGGESGRDSNSLSTSVRTYITEIRVSGTANAEGE